MTKEKKTLTAREREKKMSKLMSSIFKPRKSSLPRTARLRPRKVNRAVADERREFADKATYCMRCLWNMYGEPLDVHEILRGRFRAKSKLHRECWLALCRKCHNEVQDWPLAKQLRLKLAADPLWFDLDKIREIYGGGVLVTMDDLRKETI